MKMKYIRNYLRCNEIGCCISYKSNSKFIIPKNLQNRWKLTVGTSSEKLEKIFQSIEKADIFLHDSLHTYKNMLLEFQTAWPFIKNNGFLLSDDIDDNNAFLEFYLANEGHPILLKNTKNMETTLGILRKN